MKLLAIESSAKCASCALYEDTALIGESFLNCGMTHSVTLLPTIEGLLSAVGASMGDIDEIAVAVGPGSFTGLRIGVATAKGLALAHDIPCVGVSTLEALAWNLAHTDATLCCVMDARAGQVYNAIFKAQNGGIVRVCPDRAIKISEINDKNFQILLGDGAKMCYNIISNTTLAPEELLYQRATGVARAAMGKPTVSAPELSISYLRLPQAERERLKKIEEV